MPTTTEHVSASYRKKAIPTWLVDRLIESPRRRIYERFALHFPPTASQRVLNLGCNASSPDPARYFFEARYPYRDRIVACGLESGENIARAYPEVAYRQVSRNEARLPFQDGEFDVVFCNAVLEHVGDRAKQRAFLSEILRVGRGAFVTTPNRWYPVETHTALPLLHYLPTPAYRAIYRRLGFGFFAEEDNLNLFDQKTLLALVPESRRSSILLEQVSFLGLPSNLLLIAEPSSAYGTA